MLQISEAPEWNIIFNLLLDPAVSEVESNGPKEFFIKRSGQRMKVDSIALRDDTEYMNGIERGLAPFVKSMNVFNPNGYLFEGRLNFSAGGTDVAGRCHIVLPPACDYPQVTIAKKTASLKTIDAIAAMGSMSTEMMEFLTMAVQANLTIVFSGGTGAGKNIHKNTLISTPTGLKKAEQIRIGDTIFDENGCRTEVLKKYSPNEKNFYEIVFANGEKIEAGGGHIWKVLDLHSEIENNTLFTIEEVSRLVEALEAEDTMVTIEEIVNIVRGRELSEPIPIEDKNLFETLLKNINGFGVTGGELFTFNRFELLGKVSAVNAEEGPHIISELELLDSDTISLNDFVMLTGDNNLAREVLGEMVSAVDKTFYNKNEVLSYLLKCNNDLGVAYSEVLLSTDELFERGVGEFGSYNYAVKQISAPVDYDEQDLEVDPYLFGFALAQNFSDHNSDVNVIGDVYDESLLNAVKISSISQRKAFLAGVVDATGLVNVNEANVSIELLDNSVLRVIREIVASLGWRVKEVSSHTALYNTVSESNRDFYVFSFVPRTLLDLRVDEKFEQFEECLNNVVEGLEYTEIVYIKEVAGVFLDYYCFGVDSLDHTYLVGESFVVTHNTTMLEALAKTMSDELRIGVAEDTPELMLTQPNVSYLHSVPWQPGMDENSIATLSWVVQQFQRMRTDKLIIGETRGKEFSDFLVAANSGMEGSMTTIHADDPTRCLMKMTNFALKGSERQPIRAINADIANAVDIIVQLVIVKGKHRISHIQEIVPTLGNTEEAKITTAPLYLWDRAKDGFYKESVMSDSMRERVRNAGIDIQPFLSSQRGVLRPAHGGGKGMPTNTQPRTLPTASSLPTTPGGRRKI